MARRALHRIACAAVLAAGITFVASCSSGGDSGKSTAAGPSGSASGTTLRVALYNNFPPDASVENGKIVGWVPDMLDALEKESGLHFDITGVKQFDGLIPGLQSGRFDMSPSLFYITPERLKVVDLVTISQVGTSFGAGKTNTVTVGADTDICGHKIATLSGSVFPTQIAELNKKCTGAGKAAATVQVYPDDSAAVLSVTNNRNDLYAGTTDQVAYLQQKGQLALQPYVYDQQLEAIAFPKGSKYEAPIQTAINNLIKSGEYGKVLAKWDLGAMAITESATNPSVN